MPEDPYAALGLDPGRAYSDDEVRAAWRRIAAATHTDLPGGGDLVRYTAASAAYAELKTGFGRTEAYADRLSARPQAWIAPPWIAPPWIAPPWIALRRVRTGRPWYLLARVLVVALVCWGCVAAAGWQPATVAIGAGALTWLTLTARNDLPEAARRPLRPR